MVLLPPCSCDCSITLEVPTSTSTAAASGRVLRLCEIPAQLRGSGSATRTFSRPSGFSILVGVEVQPNL